MEPVFSSNKEKYLFHAEEFKKFKGHAAAYCKIHNLAPHMFSYYKNMLKSKPTPQFAKIKIEPPQVLKKVTTVRSVADIDPEWLAKLIHNLFKIK
jgi:hypothetical protein